MSISEQIETIVKSLTDNNIPSQLVTIAESYTDLRCDVQTNTNRLKRVRCSNVATKGKEALLIYLNGDPNQPFVLVFTSAGDIDLHDYYTKTEVDNLIRQAIEGVEVDLSNYYTITQINNILSSYVSVGYLNSNFSRLGHIHSQYITRDEISDLDIDLTTLNLVPYSDNPNGVMCFDRVQKTIEELDISLSADTMSNGYLKIEANLIERSS